MAEFRIPIRILYGDGTLEHISGLRGDRMLLVHDCDCLLYTSDAADEL